MAQGFVVPQSDRIPAAPSSGGMTAVPLPDRNPPMTWRTMTPQEAAASGYGDGGTYQVSSTGEVKRTLEPPKAKEAGGGELTAEARSAAKAKVAAARQLRQQLATVRQIYEGGIGAGRSLGEYLPTEENKTFDAAVAGLMPLARQAFRVPGSGADSDKEAAYLENILPNRWSFDAANEQRLQQLQDMIDAVEREYGPMAGEEQQAPPVPAAQDDIPALNYQVSDGQTRTEVDPRMQKVAGRIGALIAQGAPRNRILGAGVMIAPELRDDPRFLQAVDEALKFRASPQWQQWQRLNKGKSYPVDPSFFTREVPLSDEERQDQEGAMGAGQQYLRSSVNALTAGHGPQLAGLMGGDEDKAAMDLAAGGQINPKANFLGSLSGGTLTTLLGEGALAKLGMKAGFGRGLLADTGYGGATGIQADENGNYSAGNVIQGALTGAVGSVAGQGGAKALGAVTRGVVSPAVKLLRDEGIPLTLGQTVGDSGRVGAVVRGIEDRIAGVPGIGDVVAARRGEGLAAMNAATFDRVLEPIGATVNGKVGKEAVAEAQQHVGNAFQAALAGKSASVDRSFITQAAGAKRAIQGLPPRVAVEVESSVDEVISNYFDPATLTISGENLQAALRELGQIKRAYANDPLGHRIGKSVDQVEKSLEGLFSRQAPEVMPAYKAAKDAYRRLSIVEDAVNAAKNSDGMFTAAQLGQAERANGKKFGGKSATAAGKTPFDDFQSAAQKVLPGKVPDSGTAGRLATLAVPGVVAGSGAGAGYAAGDPQSGAGAGLGLAALLALAYSRQGQRALSAAATRRTPGVRRVGERIGRAAGLSGHIVGSQAALPGN